MSDRVARIITSALVGMGCGLVVAMSFDAFLQWVLPAPLDPNGTCFYYEYRFPNGDLFWTYGRP